MGHAMRGLSTGKRLTDAAHDAGFSSSAHFSFAFKEMFGLAPSLLVKQGLRRAGD
jgi:methylphosphotriester-DNA--protein-cysteine methyltransferase